MFNKDDLDTIRKKIDILEFLENRGVSFRESGISWVGLCPVHSERSPSFHVKPAQQTFRCYGCGISGDIFSLVQEMESLSFPGAVQMLAEEANIDLKMDDDPAYKQRQKLLTITRLTAEWFRYSYSKIPMDHPAKQNLEDRDLLGFSISDESVGFAPNGGLLPLLRQKGFTDDDFVEAGIASRNDKGYVNERFRNRLVWTIYDISGRPIAFSARKIFDNDTGAKYINSPQTPLYNKSKALLGVSFAKREIAKQQKVYVVEGQTDTMALRAAGKQNTVASCGTSFGVEHANMLLHLSKLGKEAEQFQIIFCFDGDEAGTKAAKRVFESNPNIQLNSYVVQFTNPDGSPTDPCDYRKDFGDEALNKIIDTTQITLVEFILSEERKRWDLKTPEGKSNYITSSLKILEQLKDSIQKSAYLRKIAGWTGTSYSELENWLSKQSRNSYNNQQQDNTVVAQPSISLEGDPNEVSMLAALVQYPTESITYIDEYGIDSSFFPTLPQVFDSVLSNARNNTLDYGDKNIIELSHVNLIISDERKQNAINFMFKQYLHHLYTLESNKLDTLLFSDSGEDPVKIFEMIETKQSILKEKYLERKPVTTVIDNPWDEEPF